MVLILVAQNVNIKSIVSKSQECILQNSGGYDLNLKTGCKHTRFLYL